MTELLLMAEEVKPAPAAVADTPADRNPKKKKSWPTNCVQSNKRIRRKDWYYRNGKYFANKKSFHLYVTQDAEKAAKAKANAAATAPSPAAPASEPTAPAGS